MAVAMLQVRGEDAYAKVADSSPNVEVALGQAQMRAVFLRLIEAQPDPERTLLMQHYFHDATMEQAGKSLGLSKSWASRVHARGIEALSRALRRESFEQ